MLVNYYFSGFLQSKDNFAQAVTEGILIFVFHLSDTTLGRCYAKVEGSRCSEPLMRFLTLSQCCCGMENGGQRGWDDPCTPCPVKGTGRLNCAVESFHSEEVAAVLPFSCLTLLARARPCWRCSTRLSKLIKNRQD